MEGTCTRAAHISLSNGTASTQGENTRNTLQDIQPLTVRQAEMQTKCTGAKALSDTCPAVVSTLSHAALIIKQMHTQKSHQVLTLTPDFLCDVALSQSLEG